MLALGAVVLLALLSFLMHLLNEELAHSAVLLGSQPVTQISAVVRSAQADAGDRPMAAFDTVSSASMAGRATPSR